MKEYKLRKREKILEEKIVALQDTKKNTHSLILKIEKNLDPNSSYLKEKAINLLEKNRNKLVETNKKIKKLKKIRNNQNVIYFIMIFLFFIFLLNYSEIQLNTLTGAIGIQSCHPNCGSSSGSSSSGSSSSGSSSSGSSSSGGGNSAPSVSNLALVTTNILNNGTNQNLTAYWSTSDDDGNLVKNITNWFVNGSSLTVLNMPFERINGTIFDNAWDYSGHNNNGSINGATWNSTGGFEGKGAYEFDGINDYIHIVNNNSLDTEFNEISVEAWVYPNFLSGSNYIVGKWQRFGTTDRSYNLRYGYGSLYFHVENSDDQDGYVVKPGAISVNKWWHIVGTWNGSLISLFVNGVNVANNSFSGNKIYNSSIPLAIGKVNGHENYNYFNGTIDEVKIYNRSLSKEQINVLYNNRTNLIISQETTVGEDWSICITPNDGNEDGNLHCSGNVTVLNSLPNITSLILNTTNILNNDTNQNLTAYWSTSDDDSDLVKNITNWFVNGSSLTVFNMPFEKINGTDTNNTWDYSGYGNNGSINDATWNSTGGFDGKGAYLFTDNTEYINVGTDSSLSLTNSFTIVAWINASSSGPADYQTIINRETTWQNRNYWFTLWTDGTLHLRFSSSSDTTECDVADDQDLRDSKWHHVVGSYNGTNCMIYLDGNFESSDSVTNSPETGSWNTYIGTQVDETGRGFDGYIDDVMIFNRSLSTEQVNTLFNNRTDLIVNNETKVGDTWKICVTPNDGNADGNIICSKNVTIKALNNLPTAPVLVSLINGSTTINRTPTLVWNNSEDNDNDIISYNLLIDDNSAFNNPEVNVTSIVNTSNVNTTYEVSTILDVDTTYFWKVAANDSSGYGDFSDAGNFTVQSYLSFNLLIDTVDFGTVDSLNELNTTDNNPLPFKGENTGNINQNVTINASKIFILADFPSSAYMFKVRGNESGAYNSTLSKTTWQNFSNISSVAHVVDLNWLNIKDDFMIDLNLTVPVGEPAGSKQSTVIFSVEG